MVSMSDWLYYEVMPKAVVLVVALVALTALLHNVLEVL